MKTVPKKSAIPKQGSPAIDDLPKAKDFPEYVAACLKLTELSQERERLTSDLLAMEICGSAPVDAITDAENAARDILGDGPELKRFSAADQYRATSKRIEAVDVAIRIQAKRIGDIQIDLTAKHVPEWNSAHLPVVERVLRAAVELCDAIAEEEGIRNRAWPDSGFTGHSITRAKCLYNNPFWNLPINPRRFVHKWLGRVMVSFPELKGRVSIPDLKD